MTARRSSSLFFYFFAVLAVSVNVALVYAQYRAQGKLTTGSAASLLAAALLIVSIVFFARDRKVRSEPK